MALLLASCGGLSEQSFETDSGSWVLFTQPRLLMGGRTAQVLGFVEMDHETGCIYLHQPEFEVSYPSVWPSGTVVTGSGLRLGDGREIPAGEWVSGGGGYADVDELEGGESSDQARVLERCPGVNNQYGEVAEFDSPASEIQIGE
ncbi:MAG TPA: hypothetical protein VIC07_07875 [Acidimicrobiia bacterium]